ncbi:hypothetical protein PtA15_2A199 [Puccinia triticina]|uniref:Uncharacterized protein n=1 Tax=Puccinia triticina TaxID=208348 RepID=A0ABY7C9N1_9BASI|nr:uncharacterized protein PtA15_2A199 [Puccinia triticina]WAQ81886.1 hypothetical protein PtA15_2A199 [Puccinia triticina]WAR52774.1 hypothetical protein PtB15_2B199 [Puccinia triticina]
MRYNYHVLQRAARKLSWTQPTFQSATPIRNTSRQGDTKASRLSLNDDNKPSRPTSSVRSQLTHIPSPKDRLFPAPLVIPISSPHLTSPAQN